VDGRSRVARRPDRSARRLHPAPGHHGVPLWTDDLRRHEGVLAAGRAPCALPAPRPRRPVRAVGPPDGHARTGGGGLRRGGGGAAARRRRLGAASAWPELLPAAVPDRRRDAPVQPARRGVPVRGDRQPRPARHGRARADPAVGVTRVRPRGRRRHGHDQVRRQLRRLLPRAAGGRGARLPPGRLAGRARAPVRRRGRRLQPVLRRGRPARHAAAERDAAGRHHPRFDPAAGGTARPDRRRRAGHPRRLGTRLPGGARHRDVRVRHRPRRRAGQPRRDAGRRVGDRRRHHRPGHPPPAERPAGRPVRRRARRVRLAARRHPRGGGGVGKCERIF
jgi:hypothetical protein